MNNVEVFVYGQHYTLTENIKNRNLYWNLIKVFRFLSKLIDVHDELSFEIPTGYFNDIDIRVC